MSSKSGSKSRARRTSNSTKSDSAAFKPRPNLRLKTTLTRKLVFRPIEDHDIKYAWASYKKGDFKEVPEFVEGLSPAEFKELFEAIVVSRYGAGWVIEANAKNGFGPVGMVLATPYPLANFFVVGGIKWFPNATKRNIIEGTVGFFNFIRKEIPMMGYATREQKGLYDFCCRHGIMSRVGTSFVIEPGQSMAVFETRV